MASKGISILYLSVGSGHQVAAEALASAFKRARPEIPVIAEDPFVDRNKTLPKILNAFQAISLTLAPNLYDLAWRGKADYDSYQWLSDIGILQEFLMDRLATYNTETVIATHVIPCILGVGLKRRSLVKNVFGVLTDFGAHSLWPTEDVDSYFVASSEVRNTLLFRGIGSTSIHVTGIPIKKISNSKAKEINQSKLRVLLIAGGIQSGAYVNTQRYISDVLDIFSSDGFENFHLTVVTGNQNQLKKELLERVEDLKLSVNIMGFVRNLPGLMLKNDILITKPGGLIVSEALATGVCLVLTEPGPGQERANYDFLARQGVALKGDTSEELGRALKYLAESPQNIEKMKMKARRLGRPNSSDMIAEKILKKIK